ncbi:MAG: glucose-6-phosphate isomerase [Pseudomonadota bacterium]
MTTSPYNQVDPQLLLQASRERLAEVTLRKLFADDPGRSDRFSIEACGLLLDYSKNRVDHEVMEQLRAWLESSGFEQRRRDLLQGETVNTSEGRAAGHCALRALSSRHYRVEGRDVMPLVRDQLERMGATADAIRSGQWRGFTGRPVRQIVNIGVGGSSLGAKMASEALRPYHAEQLEVHYVSNADTSQIHQVLQCCEPETTLFVVCSKSFQTRETLNNANIARRWFFAAGGSTAVLHRHFVAVTSNHPAANRFGIHPDQQYEMWDWVGGRYSLWSSIGLSTAILIGMESFKALLRGAEAMDQHFEAAPLHRNMPVTLALLSVWYSRFWGAQTHAVLPYDHYLRYLPEHLQQLHMESLGKSVAATGEPLDGDSGSVIWGTAGIQGQHAYFQLLHQGTRLVPADFILVKTSHNPYGNSQNWLLASAIAQMEALMNGKSEREAAVEMADMGYRDEQIQALLPFFSFEGNRPSNALVADRLTPETLGALVALYEHKTFTESVLYGVNAFDQWGVEYGKTLTRNILREVEGEAPESEHDASTRQLIGRLLGDQ